MNRHPARCLLLALLLPLSCSGGDNGNNGNNGNPLGCPGNTNVDPQSAADLPPGMPQTGYVCPAGNQHWYRIQVPSGQPVISIDLHNDTPLSPVKLSYVIRDSDGQKPIDQSPAPIMGNARQALRYSHCVPHAGTYYIEVHSFDDTGSDTRNPFTLSYTTGPNPDPAKPGDSTAAGAIALDGTKDQSGYIACKGDRSFYQVTAPDSTLLEIKLTTAAPTPSLSLQYTLVDDQMAFVASDAVPNGMSATDIEVVRALPKAGTYYLIVADQGDGSDLKVPYTFHVRPFSEPDPNDKPVRNDTPDHATALGSFSCGGSVGLGTSAYLASRADVDWYKITVSGVSPSCQAVLDVSASWGSGGQGVRPQVALVYPDNTTAGDMTPCTKDADCVFLNHGCGNDDNACTWKGQQCDHESGRCAGASVCLPEKFCGVVQYAKDQTDTGTPANVHTAQPLAAAGTYYLRVRDAHSLGYDAGTPYKLAVQLFTDDKHEPDNFYDPYMTPDNSLVRNQAFIMKNKLAFSKTMPASVAGRIAYERDQDFYVFDHPCPGADCTLQVTYSSPPSPVYFTYQVEVDGNLIAGWPAPPMVRAGTAPGVDNAVFGGDTTTCFYASRHQTGPFFLWVSDLLAQGGPLWDPNAAYTFKLEYAHDGCSTACQAAPFNCGK